MTVRWDETVQFWELIVTVGLTAIVTAFTIWVSVRLSRESVDRQLVAASDAAATERQERSAQLETDRRREAAALRARLAENAIRLFHLLEYGIENEEVELRAQWAALRIQFATSGEQNAREIYEFADLMIRRVTDLAGHEFGGGFTHFAAVTEFADDLSESMEQWVADPSSQPSPGDLEVVREWELERVRSERAAFEERIRRTHKPTPST
jgi:hypothetical protein